MMECERFLDSRLHCVTSIMGFVCRSKAVFNTPGEEDIGVYSCLVTHTDGASSSYTLSEEGESQRTINHISCCFSSLLMSLMSFLRAEEAVGDQS